MIKTMTRSLVLAAAIAVLSAIAIPSMASAASWQPANTNHTVSSPSTLTITLQAQAGLGISCNTGPTLGVHVRNPASSLLDITSAGTFSCVGTGNWQNCTIAATPTGLPWTSDGTSTTNVKINSVSINFAFTCNGAFLATWNVYGTLVGGVWTQSGLSSSAGFTNATGLHIKRLVSPGQTIYGGTVTLSTSQFMKSTTPFPFVVLL